MYIFRGVAIGDDGLQVYNTRPQTEGIES